MCNVKWIVKRAVNDEPCNPTPDRPLRAGWGGDGAGGDQPPRGPEGRCLLPRG